MLSTQAKTGRVAPHFGSLSPEALISFRVPQPAAKILRRDLPLPSLRTLPDEIFVKVHQQNLHPLIAAARLDVHPDTVTKRQRRLNLEPHLYRDAGSNGHKRKLTDDQLVSAHKQKLSTGKAAALLIVRPSTILSRWKRLNLKPPKDGRIKVTDEQLIIAHRRKLSTIEAGEIFGIDPSNISRGWKFLDLVPHGNKKSVTDEQLTAAFEKGLNSEQARKKLKVSRSLVCRRWKELGLVPKGSPAYHESNPNFTAVTKVAQNT
jgi:hypothetical protein